jgi:hypothetical protein
MAKLQEKAGRAQSALKAAHTEASLRLHLSQSLSSITRQQHQIGIFHMLVPVIYLLA